MIFVRHLRRGGFVVLSGGALESLHNERYLDLGCFVTAIEKREDPHDREK